jgi:hypothetical protein
MAGSSPDDADYPPPGLVSIIVLSVKPVTFDRSFAPASVKI